MLDTNVLISGLFDTKTPPTVIADAWRTGEFQLVVSVAILEEVRDVLTRPWVRTRLAWTQTKTDDLVHDIRLLADIVDPAREVDVIVRDPDDNRVLEAAVAGHAGYIVTGDKDLLGLGAYDGIQIVTPAAFVALLAR